MAGVKKEGARVWNYDRQGTDWQVCLICIVGEGRGMEVV
jgi:hypothetical protein